MALGTKQAILRKVHTGCSNAHHRSISLKILRTWLRAQPPTPTSGKLRAEASFQIGQMADRLGERVEFESDMPPVRARPFDKEQTLVIAQGLGVRATMIMSISLLGYGMAPRLRLERQKCGVCVKPCIAGRQVGWPILPPLSHPLLHWLRNGYGGMSIGFPC